MSNLIKITTKDGKQLVSARELHEFLEIKILGNLKRRFKNERIKSYRRKNSFRKGI